MKNTNILINFNNGHILAVLMYIRLKYLELKRQKYEPLITLTTNNN